MKIVTTEQIRELDRMTIEKYGVPGYLLMERAGRGVADGVKRLCRKNNLGRNITLVAGHGNNGGDAFAAARVLKEDGFAVNVLMAGVVAELKNDALEHFKKMAKSQIGVHELVTDKDWQEISGMVKAGRMNVPDVVVDGVLGTGINGAPRDAAAAAIRFINALSSTSFVLSIDIPSGLNSDTGIAESEAVRADLTVTMGLPKIGLVQQSALEYIGALEVVDIGFPQELAAETISAYELITPADLQKLFPRRKKVTNKGDYGHLLIIGGAAGYSGAITLAALSAVRSGAGLVTVVVPERLAPVVAGNVPEAMVNAAPETKEGSLDSACWDSWNEKLKQFTAIVAGPGMTRHAETFRLIELILHDSNIPVLLDADALNVFEGQASKLSRRKEKLVITPHPGEMARLLGIATNEVQTKRFEVAQKASVLANATVVLKGAGTLVAEQNKPLQINLTGNPGMAAGGMGDVLSGLLGGLLAQRMQNFDAARAAVFLHGRAGDLAAAQKTENVLIARDLIEKLPAAFQEVVGR